MKKTDKTTTSSNQLIHSNRKAFHNYTIIEKLEAGVCLLGTEIKSIRSTGCNLIESYVRVDKKFEAWVYQLEIPEYRYGNIQNHEPMRRRKLLLNKKEIYKIFTSMEQKGLWCVPLKLYLKNGKAKIQIGLGKSKKLYDKRETIKKRESDKAIQRATKRII